MNPHCKIGTMYRAKKPLLCELNEHLICKLCKGYFIDATTVIECLHTFCRSCIVKYLETTKYCPTCDVQVHKSKPLSSLRPDKIIQDVVYKLVPRLYQNELERRREFQKNHSNIKVSASEESFEASQGLFLSPEEELSVTLTYYGSLGKPRYLRCPSAVSVMVLQKLIRAKFGLSDSHHVDILHNQDCLSPLYTLMDIMYIYKLSKVEPLDLTYRIYEYMAKKLKIENRECKNEISNQQPVPNNNNWKEVQLRISENGEMSITGIQDDLTARNFSEEMIEVLDSKPKSPSVNPAKKKDIPELKIVSKPKPNKCINIINETIIKPYCSEPLLFDKCASSKGISSVTSSITVPSINCLTSTVFTTVNSTKCSTGTPELKKEKIGVDAENKTCNSKEVKDKADGVTVKGMKRKYDDLSNGDSKTVANHNTKKIDSKAPVSEASDSTRALVQAEIKHEEIKADKKFGEESNRTNLLENKEKSQAECIKSTNTTTTTYSNSNNGNKDLKRREEIDKSLMSIAMPPKPSTKYQGASQPCYMPKTLNPVLNIPKLHQSNATAKNDIRSSPKATKNEAKANSSSSCAATSNSSSTAKQKLNAKVKANAPLGYKTLKDPPKSWNSQISKANMNKAQPDQKYTDLKNVRPAKFFKMRNNMLRFLGNPASGVKPMYSVHTSPEQDKPPEKVVDNKEIKKHSIVKIDPKTLKPITEKAPETTSLSGQITATADLKINTSSVSIFNPLKLQGSSPKSERKSPKSPQSPKHKSSPSPSPPVPKRDKPNLNFTPPNPFVPNLSSQTVNPNQFLCNTGPHGFPSYDPRVMAAYHNLFYSSTMGFPPSPLSYHLGGLDIAQRGKGFDISKIVGMQQQASSSKSPSSPQSTSKLDVPIVPPQLPYQPRPAPMSSRTSNMSPASKRPQKDTVKNEKSLQNTVEKLAMNRAKEINRAVGALNKPSPSPLEPKKSDDGGGDRSDGRKEENEAKEPQPTVADHPKDTQNKTKTSQVEPMEPHKETEKPKNVESDPQKEPNSPGASEKPPATDQKDATCETRTDETVSSGGKDSSDDASEKVDDSAQGVNSNRQTCEANSDKSEGTKNLDPSEKEDGSKAGSEKIDGLEGNK